MKNKSNAVRSFFFGESMVRRARAFFFWFKVTFRKHYNEGFQMLIFNLLKIAKFQKVSSFLSYLQENARNLCTSTFKKLTNSDLHLFRATNSLVNATFGSEKKLCQVSVLTSLAFKHKEKCVLVKEFLFHSTC